MLEIFRRLSVSERFYRTATIAILSMMALACTAAIMIPAGLGWDFANYYDAGHKALIGQFQDLYNDHALIAGRPPQGYMLFLSTPITSYLYTPLALLQPGAALVAFKIQNTLAIWLSLGLIWHNTRTLADPSPLPQAVYGALFAGMALLFQPLWMIYRVGGQVTPTILLLLTVGWLAHSKTRYWISALCFVAAVAMKPFLAPGLMFLTLFSPPRFLWAAVTTAAASALLSVGLLGWPLHEVFLRRMFLFTNEIVWPKYNSALLSWLDPLWIDPAKLQAGEPRPPGLVALAMSLRLATVAAFAWLGFGARRLGEARHGLIFLLAMIFPLFVTPVAWAHYLSLLFPLLAWMTASRHRFTLGSRTLLALIVALSVGQNLILILWLENRIGFDTRAEQLAIGFFNSLPLLLSLGLLVQGRTALYGSFDPRGAAASPALPAEQTSRPKPLPAE